MAEQTDTAKLRGFVSRLSRTSYLLGMCAYGRGEVFNNGQILTYDDLVKEYDHLTEKLNELLGGNNDGNAT